MSQQMDLSADANELLFGKTEITVLEAGCGSASRLKFDNVARVVGIDIDDDQLANNAILDEKIKGDLETYPIPASAFDVVVCWDVIEHLSSPEDALQNMFEAVKPGGIVILGFPHLLSFKGLTTKATPFWFHEMFYRWMKYSSRHFPTYLRASILPKRVVKLAEECHLNAKRVYIYEGGVMKRVRQLWIANATFVATNFLWRLVTFGRGKSLFLDSCALILQKQP